MPGTEAEAKTPATPAAAPLPKGSEPSRQPAAPRPPTPASPKPDAEARKVAQAAQDAAADEAFNDLATEDGDEPKSKTPAAKTPAGKGPAAKPTAKPAKPAAPAADDAGEDEGEEGAEDDDALEDEGDEGDADESEEAGQEEDQPAEDESRVPKVYRGMTSRERVRAARVALISSDLFTQAEIDAMPKEVLLARGAKILKQEAAWKARKEPAAPPKDDEAPDLTDESDDDGSEQTDPDEDDDEDPALEGRSDEDDDEEEAPARDRQSPAGLTRFLKLAKKSLQLTTDETDALAKQARKLILPELKKPAAQLAQAQQKLAAIQERSGKLAMALCASRFKTAVQELRSKFPMLGQAEEFKSFVSFVASHDPKGEKALGDGKEYARFVQRMAWASFGDRMEETAQRSLIESGTKGRKGAPDTSGVTPTSRGDLSEDQYADQVFSTLAADGIPKERRAARLDSLAKRRTKPKS